MAPAKSKTKTETDNSQKSRMRNANRNRNCVKSFTLPLLFCLCNQFDIICVIQALAQGPTQLVPIVILMEGIRPSRPEHYICLTFELTLLWATYSSAITYVCLAFLKLRLPLVVRLQAHLLAKTKQHLNHYSWPDSANQPASQSARPTYTYTLASHRESFQFILRVSCIRKWTRFARPDGMAICTPFTPH